jgi:hypothetical protein
VAVATLSPPTGLVTVNIKSLQPHPLKPLILFLPEYERSFEYESNSLTKKEIGAYSISATMTLHPSSANRLHIASPNPDPPPVTMATLPARRAPSIFGSSAIFWVRFGLVRTGPFDRQNRRYLKNANSKEEVLKLEK